MFPDAEWAIQESMLPVYLTRSEIVPERTIEDVGVTAELRAWLDTAPRTGSDSDIAPAFEINIFGNIVFKR